MIKKAYAMLPAVGALMTIENIIDNERRQNTFGMLMSLNMLIENGDAFDYTFEDFNRWVLDAGFTRNRTDAISRSCECSRSLQIKIPVLPEFLSQIL